jgi:CBS domain containing-hemolysin-like protein
MKNIHLVSLDSNAHLVQPEEFNDISLTSSVRTIFTDFKKYQPLVIEVDTLACDALFLMHKSHVHLQLVVDHNNEFIGTISQSELNEQQFLIQQKKGINRYQLTVGDLMVDRENIKGLHYRLLDIISIADLIESLKKEGMQHCLVTDPENKQIRGVISARDISRRLHIPVDIQSPQTFVNIFEAVNDSYHRQYAF